jgi:hypothetical protein
VLTDSSQIVTSGGFDRDVNSNSQPAKFSLYAYDKIWLTVAARPLAALWLSSDSLRDRELGAILLEEEDAILTPGLAHRHDHELNCALHVVRGPRAESDRYVPIPITLVTPATRPSGKKGTASPAGRRRPRSVKVPARARGPGDQGGGTSSRLGTRRPGLLGPRAEHRRGGGMSAAGCSIASCVRTQSTVRSPVAANPDTTCERRC